MVQIEQTPAEVDIIAAVDDSFSSLIDLDISLTGKTVAAQVDLFSGGTQAFTVVNTNLASGQVTISLTSAQMTSIGVGEHRWFLRYYDGSSSRRAFAGRFTVIKYV
jgi:hypothetical protein